MAALIFLLLVFCFNAATQARAQGQPNPSPTPSSGSNNQTASVANENSTTDSTKTSSTDIAKPTIKEPLIHPGDTLEMFVSKRPEFDWRGQIDSDGNLPTMPYVEMTIRAACRTENAVAQDLAKAFSKYIRDPKVTVRIIDRAGRPPAIINGAIRAPQRLLLERSARLTELIALSGGITEKASGAIQIYRAEPLVCAEEETEKDPLITQDRQGNPIRVIKIFDLLAGKENMNPVIRPGDIITILEAEPVYLIGGIATPQAIDFREGLSLTRAIATAGGLGKDGKASEIRIYRRITNPTEQGLIEADLNAIRKGKKQDIEIKPYDIIEVGQSGKNVKRRPLSQEDQDALTRQKPNVVLPLRVVK
jgi:protein involved in polysaccharide export with SLBB domain